MVVSKAFIAALALITLAAASAGLARATEMYTHDAVTLRSGPGDKFGTVSTLGTGEQITVLWCNAANWCRVQSDLFQGWAPMADLIPIGSQGLGGVSLDKTSQTTSSTDPNISAIIAASPGASSAGGGSGNSSENLSSGAGLSLSAGGSSLLSLKVR